MIKVHNKAIEEMEYKGIKLIPFEVEQNGYLIQGYKFEVLGKEYNACDIGVDAESYEEFVNECFGACKLRIDSELGQAEHNKGIR